MLCIEESETNEAKIFSTIFGYLIIAVGAFIYDELILQNFQNLNENIQKVIDKKANNDMGEYDR